MSRGWLALALVAVAGCGGGDDAAADAGPDAAAAVVPPTPEPCSTGAQPGRFCDATEAAGIDRVQTSNPALEAGIVGGVALADFDGDGDLDLYATGFFVSGVYYRNDGDGGFSDATEAAGLAGVDRAAGVGAADLDGDGDQDLIVTALGERLRLFENDGAGGFTEVGEAAGLGTEARDATSVSVADYDADGDLDVYVGQWIDSAADERQSPPNLLFRNEGGLAFVEVGVAAGAGGGTTSFTLATAFFDADGDGALDLYVANDFGMMWAPSADLRNAGDGTFAAPDPASGGEVEIFAMSASPADFDDDGDIDLYTTNVGANVLLENDGAGGFTDVAADLGVAAYGYRDDSQLYGEFVPFDPQSENEVERALAAWSARYLHPELPQTHVASGWAALWLDYDLDGGLDLYVCNGVLGGSGLAPEGRRQPNQMFRRDGAGFADVSYEVGASDTGDARGCAYGDLDGDGDLDLVIANNGYDDDPVGGRLTVLRNDAATGHFARVHLVGTASNREGIGARVELTPAGGATMHRTVSGGDGYLSVSQRDVVFGLGAAGAVAEIRVTWPSGMIDVVTGQSADGTIEIVEGSSPP